MKLGFKIWPTNLKVLKIDGSTLEIFGMVLANFQFKDKFKKAQFFQKTLLVADISVEMILEILFLTFNNANMLFVERELIWRAYSTVEVLFTTKWMQIINRKNFAAAALVPTKIAFVVHITYLDKKMLIHSAKKAQIAFFITKKVAVSVEYSDYLDIFLEKSAAELSKRFDINEHAINLKTGKQLPYRPIYSLGLVELETLKTYIKTNLANGFICPFKSPIRAPIFFV